MTKKMLVSINSRIWKKLHQMLISNIGLYSEKNICEPSGKYVQSMLLLNMVSRQMDGDMLPRINQNIYTNT